MGWLTQMLSPEDPAAPLWPISWGEGIGGNDSGIQINELNSRSASGVLACTRVISEAAAAYPKEIYQDMPDGKRLATEHALYPIIHDAPNPMMTNFVFWVGIITQACLSGNGYAQIQRDGSNRARALWPMPSGSTRPVRENGVLSYKVTINGGERDVAAADMIHIPFLSLNGIEGQSPITLRRQGLGMSMAAERFGAMLFGKGARPSGVLETTGILKPEQKANLKASWQEGTSGANAMGVALLEPGITFKPLTIDPKDAQFLETRKYQLEEICRDYRVPAHMVGILERATHSNAEQLGYDFSTYTMLAWVLMIEQELNRKLFAGTRFYVKLNMDVFLRGDFETRMAGYQIMRNVGVLNGNDICRMEAWAPIPDEQGGNIRIVPMNYMSLERMKKQEDEPDLVANPDAPGLGGGEGDDGPPPPSTDNAAELRGRFAYGFLRLFQDATGRTINRDKKDTAFVQRVWLPTLTALAESMASLNGKTELPAEVSGFLADYTGALAQRCTSWQKETSTATAAAEFNRAFTAFAERV